MAESKGITIRFPPKLFESIQKCADARGKKFSAVVVETCEAKYETHSIASRVANLEQEVSEMKKKLP